jgi:hypothetical protein
VATRAVHSVHQSNLGVRSTHAKSVHRSESIQWLFICNLSEIPSHSNSAQQPCLAVAKEERVLEREEQSVTARFYVTTFKVSRCLFSLFHFVVCLTSVQPRAGRSCHTSCRAKHTVGMLRRYHKACYPSSRTSWWCQAYLRLDLRGDQGCSEGLPRVRHPRCCGTYRYKDG